MGILITKSAPDAQRHLSKKAIPGLVGMNIIGQYYQELFSQHGQALFEVPDAQQAVGRGALQLPVVNVGEQDRLVGAIQGSKKRPKPRLHGMVTSHWDEACEASFQALKDRLVSAPVLGYADFTSPFILEIGASHAGLGAMLSQDQEGQRHPIAVASQELHPSECNMSNYSAMKLELLPLKRAVTEKFREYLLGTRFTVYTNHNPLSYLQSAKLGAVEQCWASQLALFNYEINLEYRSGTANGNADALSRLSAVPVPHQVLRGFRFLLRCL
ncbi:hypothetical protein SRHO_G00230850 [Serrasalmus rhombeus]